MAGTSRGSQAGDRTGTEASVGAESLLPQEQFVTGPRTVHGKLPLTVTRGASSQAEPPRPRC